MFLILRGNRPIARLDRAEGKWTLDYLPSCETPINPALPLGSHTFDSPLPRFLKSMLPSDARAIAMAKSRHIDPADLVAMARQCLASENIGDLRLVTNITMIADPETRLAGGLTVESAAPNALHAESLEALAHPDVANRLNETLKTLASATGVGGAWPKAFLHTPEKDYIVKKYPAVYDTSGSDLAAMEAASAKALASLGEPTAASQAIGDMLLVERFDRKGSQSLGICHAADLDPEVEDPFAGSHESIAKLIRKHAGEDAAKAFARQAMFTWALGDSDHHRENYALVRTPEGLWEMAPYYDAVPSRFITGDKAEMALTVNAKKAKISLKDWEPLAKIAGLTTPEVADWLTKSVLAIQEHVLPVAGKIAPALKEHLGIVALVAQNKPFVEAQRAVMTRQTSLSRVLPAPAATERPSVGGR
jgi:hypothetical protein